MTSIFSLQSSHDNYICTIGWWHWAWRVTKQIRLQTNLQKPISTASWEPQLWPAFSLSKQQPSLLHLYNWGVGGGGDERESFWSLPILASFTLNHEIVRIVGKPAYTISVRKTQQQQRSLGSNTELLVVRTDCCNVQRARRRRRRRGLLTLQLCLEWNLQWQLGTQSGRRNPQIWQSPAWCSCGRCAQCRCLQWYQHFECHSGQRGRALWHHGMVSVHTWTLQVDSTSAHAAWCDSCCLLQSSLSWLHREASHYPLRASRQCHPLPTKQKQLDKDSIKHIIIIIIIKCCRKQVLLLPPSSSCCKQTKWVQKKKKNHSLHLQTSTFLLPTTTTKQNKTIGEDSIK